MGYLSKSKQLYKIIVTSGAIFILLFSNVNALLFSDVLSDNNFFPFIENLANRGIVNGYNDGNFRPNNAVTRGELAKFIVKSFELESEVKENKFTDLNTDSNLFDYIIILSNLEIVNGYTDNTFRETNIVTRGEATKFIVNAVRLKNNELFNRTTELEIFKDVNNVNVFFDYVNRLASIKLTDGTRIINGIGDGNFGVHDAITRGQISKIISQTISYFEDGGSYNPPTTIGDTIENDPIDIVIIDDDILSLATYKVVGNNITEIEVLEGQDKNKHLEIWNTFTDIIPLAWRESVSEFIIFSDGEDGAIASVYRDYRNLDNFVLTVDINDVYTNERLNTNTLQYALIHELAHLFTLNSQSVDITEELYRLSTDEEIIRLRDAAALLCDNYYTFDGCTTNDSYINIFVENYWTSRLLDELDRIYVENSLSERDKLLMDFYRKYQDTFISPYSVTHPDEDIAESFTYFVLNDKPVSEEAIKNQKILFFYDYPELVDLRKKIREKL